MSKKHLYWLAGTICLIGLVIFFYKAMILKLPLVSEAQIQKWDIEVKINYKPVEGPVKVRLFVPHSNKRTSITDEQFVSPGYGLGVKLSEGNRQAVWSSRTVKGVQVLYYKCTVRPGIAGYAKETKTSSKIPVLEEFIFLDAQRLAAESIVAEARAKSADTESFVQEVVQRINRRMDGVQQGQVAILLGKDPDIMKRLGVVKQLLVLEKIPARIVNGIQLVGFERSARLVNWLEVYQENEWKSYHAVTGQLGVPDDYLPWWRGVGPLVDVAGGKLQSANIAISRNDEPALNNALWRDKATRPILYEFSLLGLPLDTQLVYRTLLTVPIGILLLVVLRNIVGIKTFGTFMPVLIAMAFRETQLLWGIVLFTLVVGIGLALRFYLEQLKLLLVPRLASVLITVIIIMALISLLSHKLGFYHGLSVALFPMVILTMTIERMSIVWEERGAKDALKQGFGSLFVAILAYLVMNIEMLRHLLFMFPELLFVLLSITLLLGRYSGYRLLELRRFRVLAKEAS